MAIKTFKDYPNTTTPVTAEILKELQTNLMLTMNPIGSIVINVTNENPSTYIGGTWVAWGSGRVPVGVSSDTEFNTVEKTGGAKTHTLTIAEMPSHGHPFRYGFKYASGTGEWSSSNANWTGTVDNVNEYTGGGQAHNNLPPYITCYMFKRTA